MDDDDSDKNEIRAHDHTLFLVRQNDAIEISVYRLHRKISSWLVINWYLHILERGAPLKFIDLKPSKNDVIGRD